MLSAEKDGRGVWNNKLEVYLILQCLSIRDAERCIISVA